MEKLNLKRKFRNTKSFTVDDVPSIKITGEMILQAEEDAVQLEKENYGKNTRVGSKDRDVKGSLGQQAVHIYLSQANIPHKYSKPYEPKQYGDYGDFVIYEEIYDAKCRGFVNLDYGKSLKNFSALIGEHEKENKTDHYIFTTIDNREEYIYILGAISKKDLFKNLSPVPDYVKLKFQSAGKLYATKLKPLLPYINRV